MTSELLTIQILSAKSILNVNNNGTDRTDHEIRTHHNAQSGEFQKPKIGHEWNGNLESFRRPQVTENSRQHLLLRKDILQKKVFGCPCILLKSN